MVQITNKTSADRAALREELGNTLKVFADKVYKFKKNPYDGVNFFKEFSPNSLPNTDEIKPSLSQVTLNQKK